MIFVHYVDRERRVLGAKAPTALTPRVFFSSLARHALPRQLALGRARTVAPTPSRGRLGEKHTRAAKRAFETFFRNRLGISSERLSAFSTAIG